MRKLIMYCDRCHKEFEKWNHKRDEKIGVAELVYDDDCDPYLDSQLDLCESCYTELEKWWDCGKEEKKTCCKDTNVTISRQAVKELMIKYGFHSPDMTVTEFVENVLSNSL